MKIKLKDGQGMYVQKRDLAYLMSENTTFWPVIQDSYKNLEGGKALFIQTKNQLYETNTIEENASYLPCLEMSPEEKEEDSFVYIKDENTMAVIDQNDDIIDYATFLIGSYEEFNEREELASNFCHVLATKINKEMKQGTSFQQLQLLKKQLQRQEYLDKSYANLKAMTEMNNVLSSLNLGQPPKGRGYVFQDAHYDCHETLVEGVYAFQRKDGLPFKANQDYFAFYKNHTENLLRKQCANHYIMTQSHSRKGIIEYFIMAPVPDKTIDSKRMMKKARW